VLRFKATLIDSEGNIVTDLVSPPELTVIFDPTPPGVAVDVTDYALTNGKRTKGAQFVLAGEKWSFNLATKGFKDVGQYVGSMVSGDPSEYTIDPRCDGLFVIENRL
jgi:hypothetical protein